ncbi:gamma-glutamylcyclotransferase family protein [Noviherbaspirillum sp.]|jgi:gamma-glutamylcyclotransferase (GGCT)/AIG2-like uncharacterized protein YtfP|uniref:gamma-glutamylcyclotransferase family protein n=1 Tax=Noviherbaspirillum sp. TaxID=1926288 RepID=UPI0025F70F50|nr:gamma-glutamylcyclotransferase family protein [Noviherbaspirillum sp.]
MHVFTYGSLMFPQVWTRVVRGAYRSIPARLDGHARFAISGETYPGMVPKAGETVQGLLYFDVSAQDIDALDTFEGADYRRDAVKVTPESGEILAACTYIYLLPQNLSESPWMAAAFQMERFLVSYCRDKLGD